MKFGYSAKPRERIATISSSVSALEELGSQDRGCKRDRWILGGGWQHG